MSTYQLFTVAEYDALLCRFDKSPDKHVQLGHLYWFMCFRIVNFLHPIAGRHLMKNSLSEIP